MNKNFVLIMIGVLTIFALSIVSVSAYSQVGDIVSLPYIDAGEVSDTDFSDGTVRYVYCAFDLNVPGDTKCQSSGEMETGGCDASNFDVLDNSQLCYTNGENPLEISLHQGVTEWHVSVVAIEGYYDNNTNSWVMGGAELIGEDSGYWNTIIAPDSNFISGLYESFLSFVCNYFDFGFCPA